MKNGYLSIDFLKQLSVSVIESEQFNSPPATRWITGS